MRARSACVGVGLDLDLDLDLGLFIARKETDVQSTRTESRKREIPAEMAIDGVRRRQLEGLQVKSTTTSALYGA